MTSIGPHLAHMPYPQMASPCSAPYPKVARQRDWLLEDALLNEGENCRGLAWANATRLERSR